MGEEAVGGVLPLPEGDRLDLRCLRQGADSEPRGHHEGHRQDDRDGCGDGRVGAEGWWRCSPQGHWQHGRQARDLASFNLGTDVGPYMMSKVNADDAKAAYSAFLEF